MTSVSERPVALARDSRSSPTNMFFLSSVARVEIKNRGYQALRPDSPGGRRAL
jgi:hypothetical protein